MSEVYAALEPLLRTPEIRNLENRYVDSLTAEGIKDARSELREDILTNLLPFWNAESRPAWLYSTYRHLLIDKVRYETRRDSKLFEKAMLKYQDQINLLKQRSIDTNEDLSVKIAKIEEKLRSLTQLQHEINDRGGQQASIPEPGCGMYCLEKLAKDDPKRYALFVTKVLDHSPDQTITVVRGILNKDYTPFAGTGQMLNKLKSCYGEITNPETTEAQIADLLSEVFGYADGEAVSSTISQIKKWLRNCVVGCGEKIGLNLKKKSLNRLNN